MTMMFHSLVELALVCALVIIMVAMVFVFLSMLVDNQVEVNRAEVEQAFQRLVDAINAGDQEKAEEVAVWLDEYRTIETLSIEQIQTICAWCEDDARGICEECLD